VEANIPAFLLGQILPKMEKFCAFQERCVYDVKMKLMRMNVEKSQWDSVIKYLQENNFLNEERFAELFVRSKIRQKGWGPVKIKMELLQKQISPALIEQYLSAFECDNQQTLLHDWLMKKYASVQNEEVQKQREKLIRFGISKGFESGMVFSETDKIIKAHSKK